MTSLKGVSHIGLGVRDLDRSIRFYRDILGLEVVHTMDYDEVPQILRHPDDLRRKAAYFRVGEGEAATVLVIGTINEADRTTPLLLDELGVHHFAFWVDDIELLARRLADAGIETLLEPVEVSSYALDLAPASKGSKGPWKTMFFRDPDGIMLQADQRPPVAA